MQNKKYFFLQLNKKNFIYLFIYLFIETIIIIDVNVITKYFFHYAIQVGTIYIRLTSKYSYIR